MKSEASGFAGLPTSRVNLPAMVDRRRNGLGDSYAVVAGVPRLNAMAVAAAMRNGDPRGGGRRAGRKQTLDEVMARGVRRRHAWGGSRRAVEAGAWRHVGWPTAPSTRASGVRRR